MGCLLACLLAFASFYYILIPPGGMCGVFRKPTLSSQRWWRPFKTVAKRKFDLLVCIPFIKNVVLSPKTVPKRKFDFWWVDRAKLYRNATFTKLQEVLRALYWTSQWSPNGTMHVAVTLCSAFPRWLRVMKFRIYIVWHP